ncbi:MAG: class II D-tagatose-bisphosphate aldolase, non-catalytic subunit [Lachnospiraceae bacterium]|nr:class II D-tagatose-bisphosphate aldolase, non-catalytic subunit [Lachnospiraceae bacterium]
MKHPMQEMMDRRRNGELTGIPSYCTANELVLEACLKRARLMGTPVLIEATANQVNQFGGYTGMKPADYYQLVMNMAKEIGVPEHQVILGGDHLGPLTWQNDPEEAAMAKSEELVYQYVLAGFTKIHLDTSMKVADDPEGILSTETIARRGVRLYKVCMKAYEERLKEYPDSMRPVFIIGSEVPIPGGAQEEEDTLAVTKPEAFEDTVNTYTKAFAEAGVPDGMKDVIAVVVQPGVEFGDDQVFYYNSEAATDLCAKLKEYPNLIFEGHSTDYQTAESLRDMVVDGIAILKVGPAVTYGLREGLFALSMMEKELVSAGKRASLIETIEEVMTADPGNWQKHYHGSFKELGLARKYSYSDRVRYYMGDPKIKAAIEQLFANLSEEKIPMNMLHQYMPVQYRKVCKGELKLDPKELALDGAVQFMEDYEYAAQQKTEAQLAEEQQNAS